MGSLEQYIQDKEILFSKWKNLEHHKSEIFVEDGVVCPEKWFSYTLRPLFLLKEAYGGCSNWSLVDDYLKTDKKIEGLWKTVSLWTKGLLNTTGEYIEKFNPEDEQLTYFNNEYLKRIAVVNVKKSNGQSGSEYDNILKYAEDDKDLLKDQLKICDPTIIVCGYTIQSLNKIVGYNIKHIENKNLYYYIELNGHDVLVLDYWHPANQFPNIMNYYGLMGIYQQALLERDYNKR